MQAAVLYRPQDIKVEEVSEPRLEDGEVSIELHTAGICGTDAHIYQGNREVSYPLILGHECCGHIVQLGEGVINLREGQRVVVQPNFGCGNCLLCRTGRDNLCPSKISLGVTIDGCFAEYVKAPARYVWPIPDGISDEQGTMVEPLAVAIRAVGKMGELLGKRVMILGGGPIGLLVLQLAKRTGAIVFLTDLIEERLMLGKELGADGVVNVGKYDPREGATSLTGGKGIDVIVETAGVTRTVEQAIEIVRSGGRIVLVGIPSSVANIPPASLVWKEIEIFGSFIYSYEDFHQAIQIINEGKVKVDPLISHRFSLKDIGKAFDVLEQGKGVKVIINLKKEVE